MPGSAWRPYDYRLIMVFGPSGAGKSTLVRWLAEQLQVRGKAAAPLLEEDVYRLDALQPFTAVFDRADPNDLGLLLDAARSLSAGWHASGSIRVVDSFPPAFHWLFGNYPREHVRSYAAELASILAPLHPLLISLDIDVRAGWQRASAERGRQWSDWMVDIFSRRNLPLYSGAPIRDPETLVRFFDWVQRQCYAMVAEWPVETLVVNTLRRPLEGVQEMVLRRLEPGAAERFSPSGP